jgi:hypothetical protein
MTIYLREVEKNVASRWVGVAVEGVLFFPGKFDCRRSFFFDVDRSAAICQLPPQSIHWFSSSVSTEFNLLLIAAINPGFGSQMSISHSDPTLNRFVAQGLSFVIVVHAFGLTV